MASPDQFRRQFPVKIEPVALEMDVRQAIAAEDLIHSEGILEALAVDRVEETEKPDVAHVHKPTHMLLPFEVAHPTATFMDLSGSQNKARLK
jgi:hypothetical protein